MTEYAPEAPPITLEPELQEYLQRELSRIGDSVRRTSEVVLGKQNIAPTKPEDGIIIYADGTNFNPGSGAGIYAYINGVYVKLSLLAADAPSFARLRLTSTTELTLASTLHALQIGADNAQNLAADTDEIQSRNNGAISPLLLNPQGGSVVSFGTATNDNAPAGCKGEVISSNIPSASFVTLASNVAKDITSISLTAGDWDVYGNVYFFPNASAVITYILGSLSLTSNTNDTTEGKFAANQYPAGTVFASAFRVSLQMSARFSFAATTSVFLVGMSTFTTAANTAYGSIWARRAR